MTDLVARMLNTLLVGFGLAATVWLGLRLFRPLNSGTRFAVWFTVLLTIVALPFLAITAVGTGPVQARFVLPETLATYLLIVWGVIATVLLARLGLSLLHVRNLRRDSQELALDSLDSNLRGVFATTPRRVRLFASDRIRVPAAIGFFRPAIIIPNWAMRDLPLEQQRTILLHELAHLRRWDDWTNLAQKVLKALFFFHPAIWWIESRLSLEREMACDDMVLAEMSSPRAYAASLISLAERVGLGRTVALAQAALGRARHTSLRISQILDSKRPKGIGVWKPALGFGTAVAAIAFVTAPFSPDLVAFSNSEALGVASRIPNAPERLVTVAPPAAVTRAELRATANPEIPKAVKSARPRPAGNSSSVFAASARRETRQPRVVLVMQSTQFDETGAPLFTLSVWQISDKNRQQVRTEIVMHTL